MSLALPSSYGLILTLILVGMSSAILFKFVPTTIHKNQKHNPILYYILCFVTIASGFFIYVFKSVLNDWFVTALTHIMYILGIYFLIFGLKHRQNAGITPIYKNPWVYSHLAMVLIVHIGIFYFYYPSDFMRVLLLSLNLIFLLCYASFCVKKPATRFKRGENVLTVVIYICVVLSCIAPIMSLLSHSIETFFSYNLAVQALQLHIIFGGLFLLSLSDVIDLHYKNSVTDTMTGIYNRRYFIQKTDSILQAELNQPDTDHTESGSLILCDIDNFKKINDEYGHETGDKVIMHFGKLLERHIRKKDVLARIGGEEFAIFLPQTDLATASKIAERMRASTENVVLTSRKSNDICYTASFGVACLSAPDISTYLRAADHAMYQAKDSGRNRVCHYDSTANYAETLIP